MADPTLTNIQILRSPVPHKRPDPSLMLDGQLAVNYKAVDPGLFTKTVEGTLVKFGPASITNDGLQPNHITKQDGDGFPGNTHGETWLDGREAFHSPIHKIYDADKDDWITTSGFTVDNLTGNMTMMKWLTVDRLYANYVDVDGPLEVNGPFLPHGTNCEHDIGSGSNRWKGLYSCFMDTTGNLTVGGDGEIGGYLQVGDYLTVNSHADILGTVTIGTTPDSGDTFKVNSPATFDSTMVIVGDTTGAGMELAGDLTAKGSVHLGDGCEITTLDVHALTTFHCDVEFITQPVTFEAIVTDYLEVKKDTILGAGCGQSNLTVNSTSLFMCLTEHEGELRVGRNSKADLRAYGNFDVEGQATFGQNVVISGKAHSASTVNDDPGDTLTTKDWVKEYLFEAANTLAYWSRSGIVLSPQNPGDKVVSAQTEDSDTGDTLVTKDYLTYNLDNLTDIELGGDTNIGTNCSDTLTVTAKATFMCGVEFKGRVDGLSDLNLQGDVIIGNNCSDTLSVYSTAIFKCKTTFDGEVSFNGLVEFPDAPIKDPVFGGNVLLGDDCSNSIVELRGLTILRCDLLPAVDVTSNLGSVTNRFANIYTGDLHLKNERGDWTLIEEEDCLTMRNNKTGKRYAINMTPYEG